jgi:hypothetical protein
VATTIPRATSHKVTDGWQSLPCAGGCGKPFKLGDKVTRVEDPRFIVRPLRFKQYHWLCWPPRLEREWRRMCRRYRLEV